MAAATTSTPPPTSSPTWRSNLDPATTAATYSMYESYGYDAAGQQRSHTIVDGTTPVTSTLDAAGRTTSIAEGLGGSGPYTSTYGYNRNDLPISATMPGAVQEQVGYDSNSRPRQLE